MLTYNKSHQGRTRKYYRLSKIGKQRIDDFLTNDWPQLTLIQRFIKGGTLDEQS